MKQLLKRSSIALVVLFVLMQFVPYGRSHDNPPVRVEPQWDSPETRALAMRTCFDCHSNETVWPWYSQIAPVSWLVEHDVAEAREHLNFSEWDREQRHAEDAAEEFEEGEMPLWFYKPLHPEARLSGEERAALLRGLRTTFGESEHSEDRD